MNCRICTQTEMLEGTLEGVSFEPTSEQRRRFWTRGIYGIKASVCMNCGEIAALRLDVNVLKRQLGSEQPQ